MLFSGKQWHRSFASEFLITHGRREASGCESLAAASIPERLQRA